MFSYASNSDPVDESTCGRQAGFTLIEMSIVLAILGVILSSLMQPLGARLDAHKRADTEALLRSVIQATKGYLSLHRKLPCPASSESAGWALDNCAGDRAAGYVPGTTLGIPGPRDEQGLLLDSWGRRIRYVVSASDHSSRGQGSFPDFTSVGEIEDVGLRWLRSEIVVCESGVVSTCPRQSVRANQVPVLVYSTAENVAPTADQQENLDADAIFVARDYSRRSGDEFDDIVVWISENEFIYEWVKSTM
ncbi:MAG: type II secretion system GspH family protein [Granulosicoccus sp.]|nr:type II secretion system GspH family protein [Granulosicoccus sp.]